MNIRKITLYISPVILLIVLIYAASASGLFAKKETVMSPKASPQTGAQATAAPVAAAADGKSEVATFAGGCFWSMQSSIEKVPGILSIFVGYTGGNKDNPTYEEVGTETTGHMESVEIRFDPSIISYEELLQVYWRNINPTDAGGQFYDRGESYHTAIFYHNEEQKQSAEASKKALADSGRFDQPIVTEIRPAMTFYKAEEYHQEYAKKNPAQYESYRLGSGRDAYFDKIWGKDREVKLSAKTILQTNTYDHFNKAEKLKTLTALQIDVTQHDGTETPFNNTYWNNEQEGIYVDIVSGEPLFSSKDKYDSGTGWPSFTKPLEAGNIVVKEDNSMQPARVEVRSKNADSHLGHVFDDGPAPTGKRYCMNSASMEFIRKADLDKRGYGKYASLF